MRLIDVPAADELDDPRHDGDEPVVFLAHLAEQSDLVLGDELQPLEIVAELVQLAQRAVQGALVRHQQRRGDAVELARRVVLDLAVGRDLALALDQFFGALVDRAQLVEADSSEGDQQCDDCEKRRQQLCLDAPWQARDRSDKEGVERCHFLSTRLITSRRNSSGYFDGRDTPAPSYGSLKIQVSGCPHSGGQASGRCRRVGGNRCGAPVAFITPGLPQYQ